MGFVRITCDWIVPNVEAGVEARKVFSTFAFEQVVCVFTSTASEYLFPHDFEVNLVPGGLTSTIVESMSQCSRRPVFGLFAAAAALFYLDIPHKNSIELLSAGCSLAAF